MVKLLVLLLFVFLFAFFGGMDAIHQNLLGGGGIRIMGTSTKSPEFQAFLGGGVVFLEFAIILFSMLDRIVDTIRETIKPLARLIPLGAFLTAIYQTFTPIVQGIANRGVGAANTETAYIANAVADGSLSQGALFTLGTMILFLLANRVFGAENPEVRALRAELAKYRRALR